MLLFPKKTKSRSDATIESRERLGRLLRYFTARRPERFVAAEQGGLL